MLFPLIKAKIAKTQFRLRAQFVVKSKFLDLEFKKCSNYKDFRIDYLPLLTNRTDYQSLIRVCYLFLALRMVKNPIIAGKMAVFSYRRTKLFAKYQDIYDLSISKHFYDTIVEHRNSFFFLTVSTFFIDRIYLILCLYLLKTKGSESQTVIKKCSTLPNFHEDLSGFILRQKWKFRLVEFNQ